VPTVSNKGLYSESAWERSGALLLAPSCDATKLAELTCELLEDKPKRLTLARESRRFYEQHFSIDRTIETLVGAKQDLPVERARFAAEAR
jgi:hypothetical protein